MGRTRKSKPRSASTLAISTFSGLVVIAVFCMVVPFWTALAAGLASVSLVVFGISTLVLIVLFFTSNKSSRPLIAITLTVSLFGATIPQAAFIHTATTTNSNLTFNPRSYLSFSGDTTLPPTRTIAYKKTGDQSLEIAFYQAKASGPRPTVVLLHGGAWRYGSHLETGNWPRLLTSHGFHVASVEYRLARDDYHTWRDAPSDVHDALLYLSGHHKELHIDTRQLHLLGQSAGGHLALLEAYRFNSVRTVVSLYAPIDPAFDYETSRDKSAELDFMGGPPAQYPERYRALSPLTYSSANSPSTLIIQGKRDDLVATKNATTLRDSLQRLHVRHELILMPLTGHSFENQRGGFATQIAEQRVVDFLK